MNRLTAIVNYDFGQEDGQLLDRLAAWERQVEEHERATTETVQDSMKCAIVQSRLPGALRTHLLLNAPNAVDWATMRRSIQSYLLATMPQGSATPMDLGYLGKGKDYKGKEYKGKGKDSKGAGKDRKGKEHQGKDDKNGGKGNK
eukprot:5540149-Amphidinium_carterae.1